MAKKKTGKKKVKTADKQIQALIKKTREKVEENSEAPNVSQKNFVDISGMHDWNIADVEAEILFREMARRDF